jgi:hypothetical protein
MRLVFTLHPLTLGGYSCAVAALSGGSMFVETAELEGKALVFAIELCLGRSVQDALSNATNKLPPHGSKQQEYREWIATILGDKVEIPLSLCS